MEYQHTVGDERVRYSELAVVGDVEEGEEGDTGVSSRVHMFSKGGVK